MNIKKQITAFLSDASQRLSKNSLEAYAYDLSTFQKFVKQKEGDLANLKVPDFTEFLTSFNTVKTIHRHAAVLNAFLKFTAIPTTALDKAKQKFKKNYKSVKPSEVISFEKIRDLLNPERYKTPLEIRDLMIMDLLYAGALNVSELLELRLEDVDIENQILTVAKISAAHKIERLMPFGDVTKGYIQAYLKVRNEIDTNYLSSTKLIVSKKGDRVNRKSIWRLIGMYSRKAGLKIRVTPQNLRTSFIAHLLHNGISVIDLHHLLGNVDVATTSALAKRLKEQPPL